MKIKAIAVGLLSTIAFTTPAQASITKEALNMSEKYGDFLVAANSHGILSDYHALKLLNLSGEHYKIVSTTCIIKGDSSSECQKAAKEYSGFIQRTMAEVMKSF